MIVFLQTHITTVVTFLTLVSNIFFVGAVALLVGHVPFRQWAYGFVYKHISLLFFVASIVATLGSLGYSEIIGFPPCDLCWIQRIFMYPQVFVAFVGYIKKDKNIVDYLLGLSIIGACVAFFHSLIHWGFNSDFISCSAVNAPCAKVYVLEYGYITIPFMALSIFVYLITLSVVFYKARKQYEGK